MESPYRSRILLAFVVVVVCSVWLATGKDKAPIISEAVVDRVVSVPRAETQLPKPAHQSVALGALDRMAPVLGD